MALCNSLSRKSAFALGLATLFHLAITAVAYDPLDPNGNITITWDVTSWTQDGYVATVTLFNYQMYRHIPTPGWKLGWTWAKKEVIWSAIGSQAVEQGDCSKFTSNIPHCCLKSPLIIDMLPGVPYNQQVANCCKGGVLNAYAIDKGKAMSSFQISVGNAGNTNKTVKMPKHFVLYGPGPGYTCSPAQKATPSTFLTVDRRRKTQALMTWKVVCLYSQFLASSTPQCCVSLSTFYNQTIVPCPACSCGCMDNNTCIKDNTSKLLQPVSMGIAPQTPLIKCTPHMCPVRIHWHIMLNYKLYWRIKVTLTNFNFAQNFSDWNLVAQHPSLNQIITSFSFNYSTLDSYGNLNDSAIFWGIKYYNDILMQSGEYGVVQSQLLMRKDLRTFTLKQGWGFPTRVYFNGDPCVMPAPDTYPSLPNAVPALKISNLFNFVRTVLTTALLWIFL